METLRQRLHSTPLPDSVKTLALLSTICNHKYPSYEDILKCCGQQTYNAIIALEELISDATSHNAMTLSQILNFIDHSTDITECTSMVDTFITNNNFVCQLTNTQNAILQQWIDNNKTTIDGDLLLVVQKEIIDAHDKKWTEKRNVVHLYSDGEITCQKGGELYGHRTMFTITPRLVAKFKMDLPMVSGDVSFAIVESLDVANQLRQKLEKCFTSNNN